MNSRHERHIHPQFSVSDHSTMEEERKDETKDTEDYMFNYHQSKLMFGLILKSFEDAVKEGDGHRLFEIYKLLLLIYKSKGHTKYAYATLLYLVKICALLSHFEADRLKRNRFYNNHGGQGKNISLDLKKEHQNRLLKKMWRALGPNLNERNAARLAQTLDSVEVILDGIDKDCKLSERNATRSLAKKEEAVHQITKDLISKRVFVHAEGRAGHPSFSQFGSTFIANLDYRDLHKWMRKLIESWGSIYQ